MLRIKFLLAITCIMHVYMLTASLENDLLRVWDSLPASSLAKYKCEENERAWIPSSGVKAHCQHLAVMLTAFEADMKQIKGKEIKKNYMNMHQSMKQSRYALGFVFTQLGMSEEDIKREYSLIYQYQAEMTREAIEKEEAEEYLAAYDKKNSL